MDFYQDLEYKLVDMFNLDFVASNDDIMRASLAYRYNSWCAKLVFMQNRLKDVNSILKTSNPTLLTQLQKGKSHRNR